MQKIVVTLVIIAIGVGLAIHRSGKRDEVDERIAAMPEKVLAVCERSKDFSKYESYVLEHAQRAHEVAIMTAYEQGSRRRTPTFDSKKYALAWSESLVSQGKLARTDRNLDQFLRQLQIDLEQAAERGEFD